MSSRNDRRLIAEQTLQICEKGVYKTESGEEYDISESISLAIKNTEHLSPTITFNVPSHPRRFVDEDEEETEGENTKERETVIQITNESTLECAFRLYQSRKYKKIAILNFASAKNPGGGFLKGSQAQEESIARSSSLYVCLKDSEYYEANRKTRNGIYTNWMIYSPDLPIFRNSMTNELIKYYEVNVITCPAVNAGVFTKRGGSNKDLERVMKKRMERIIQLAIVRENDAIVLGAFGCGVFRNRIDFVSQHFKYLIETKYRGHFQNVTYAILGKSFRVFGDCYKYGTKQYIPGTKNKKKKTPKGRNNKSGRQRGEQRNQNRRQREKERKKSRKKKFEIFE